MLNNLIGSFMAGQARSRLNGYKTQIGGAALVIYGLLVVVGKIWPDMNLPGSDLGWEEAMGLIGAGLTALGLMHRAYKVGVDTQAPAYTMPVRESKGKVLLEGPMG